MPQGQGLVGVDVRGMDGTTTVYIYARIKYYIINKVALYSHVFV